MLNALQKLFYFVRLITLLGKVEVLCVVRCFFEHCSEHRKEKFVDWLKQVLKINRFESAHQICRVSVLVHIENMKLLAQYFSYFLNRCSFTSSRFTNQ